MSLSIYLCEANTYVYKPLHNFPLNLYSFLRLLEWAPMFWLHVTLNALII